MTTAIAALLLQLRRLGLVVAGWRLAVARGCDGYRPERHYMRGPGPKWHARHRPGIGAAAT